MTVHVSDPAGHAPPADDVFVARRAEILSAIIPAAVPDAAEPSTPAADPDADYLDDADENYDTSAGFLQFPSEDDDDDLDDGVDDDDHDPEPQAPAGPAARPGTRAGLLHKLQSLDWKSTKVLAGALGAVLLVVVLLIVVFKPDAPGPAPLTISAAPTTPPAPAPAPVRDVPIKVASSSGKCPGAADQSANAFDGQMDTAWVCKDNFGPGQKLIMRLGDSYVVSKVSIVPGFNKFSSAGDEWSKYQTVTKVRWMFGPVDAGKPCNLDNNCMEVTTDNKRDTVSFPVSPNKTTSVITMVVLKTTAPPNSSGTPLITDPSARVDSFAVSEIQVFGHLPS